VTRRQIAIPEAEQTGDEPESNGIEACDAPEDSIDTTRNATNGDIASQDEPNPELKEPIVQQNVVPEAVPVISDDVASEDAPRPVVEQLEDTQSSSASHAPQDATTEPATILQPLSAVISPVLSLKQPEDPIDAIDALEDAIEEVGKILPDLDATSPIKSRAPRTSPGPAKASAASKFTKDNATASGKVPSKSLLGRASSVRTGASNKLTNSTQPSATARMRVTPTTATTNSNPLARSPSTRARPTSVFASSTSSQAGKAPDYLATKRRPISVQFPTPPPPAKSTKQPTKATFQLPGEAIAAKLKAQRQERLKREEEEAAKRKAFKARPVAKSSKPVDVKQTAASRARLSVMGGVDSTGNKENGASGGGIKRSSTVTGATSSSVKRGGVVGEASKRTSVMGPPLGAASKTVAANTAQKRSSTAFAANKDFSVSVSKRQPGVVPNSTAKRVSSIQSMSSSVSSTRPKPSVTAQDVAVQRVKGKEVFNRDKSEKEARERERREKDEAMKKARAEAAERGRQASRDWAEKQKKALLEKKGLNQSTGPELTTA
jgi:hypothetical protein